MKNKYYVCAQAELSLEIVLVSAAAVVVIATAIAVAVALAQLVLLAKAFGVEERQARTKIFNSGVKGKGGSYVSA